MSPNYKFAKVRIYLTTLSQAQNSPNILHSLSSSSPERLGAKTHPWPSYRPHAILSCQSSLEPLAMLAARCDWAQIELSCIHPCKRPPTWPLSGNNLFWAAAWTTSQRTCHSWEPCIAHSSSVQDTNCSWWMLGYPRMAKLYHSLICQLCWVSSL